MKKLTLLLLILLSTTQSKTEEATQAWEKYDKLRPDYDLYVKELKIIEEANEKANAIVIDPVIDNTKK